MGIYTILGIVLLFIASTLDVWAAPKSNGEFYISGFEGVQTSKQGSVPDPNSVYELSLYNGNTSTEGSTKSASLNRKQKTIKAVSVTTEENKDGLRKTLESFQSAISGLCISHLELSLAFNVSAKAWVVVTGEVAGSVKVILKNPDEKCPKPGS